jgi:hypothetical protein
MSLQRMADAAQIYASAVSRLTAGATPGVNNTPNSSSGSAGNQEVQPGAIVQLSPGAQFFAKLVALANATPDIRPDVVASAKAQAGKDLTPDATARLAAKLLPDGS